jgi:hypothetical protein
MRVRGSTALKQGGAATSPGRMCCIGWSPSRVMPRRTGLSWRCWQAVATGTVVGIGDRSALAPVQALTTAKNPPCGRRAIRSMCAGVSGEGFDGRQHLRGAADVLAYFDRPGTSNGPTEAINGRLEHLRGSALGFRNLTNYIARSLLETGGFRPQLHPGS